MEKRSPKRMRVTDEQILAMRRHRRLLAEAEAQRKQPESQPSVPIRRSIGRISARHIRTHSKEVY